MAWEFAWVRVCALVLAGGLVACGDDDRALPLADGGVIRCSERDDPDGDFISRADDGEEDADGDGTPNWQDGDSDGDGIADVEEAGDRDCSTVPADTDNDGIPDFLDTDANGDGIHDRGQTGDTDGDGIPDWRDLDIDGDGIPNHIERGDGPEPVDTDGDGIPDILDDDSDGDTILDRHEGHEDFDGDGIPNFRDLDSDGDGILDSIEAGDGDPETPPAVCAFEVDPRTGEIEGDGLADFADVDSDNDGVPDGVEIEWGTDPCDTDSDDDGYPDIAEVAYATVNCPGGGDGPTCRCATEPGCGIPATDYFLVLPYQNDPEVRDLDFATDIRVADIFFLTDTTGSMGGTVNNIKMTVGSPGVGLIDRIGLTIPDAWFSGGQHDDFPFSPYGGGPDVAFGLAIGSTPPTLPGMPAGSGREAVATAFTAIVTHGGADGPESHTEALYQIMTGAGGMWTGSGGVYNLHRYVGDCLDTGWGAACFREAALPIVIHFTDICAHEGPPGEDSGCDPYTGITPAPAGWSTMIAAMNARAGRYIGVNASSFGGSCATSVGPSGSSPCYFLKRTAEETGSVDLDGTPLVYDLPNDSTSAAFADTIVDAVETLATRVPFDITTALRDDPTDAYGVDAREFIKLRTPACSGVAPDDDCWQEPEGVSHEDAIAAIDTSTFFAAIPGTRVEFEITFQNDFHEGGTEVRIFIAFIDVTAGGSSVLDTRQVYIVVPATSGVLM
jgi:hypothetical protein